MTGWLYWLAFIAVALLVLVVGPWLCAFLEDRADQRDQEIWMRMPGATR